MTTRRVPNPFANGPPGELSLAIKTFEEQKMELSIRTRAIETTDELRDLVTRRLQFALDAFAERIESVSVYLMDLNGPRRGVDKLCQITVRVHGIGSLAVLERSSTPAGALSGAARRVKYRVSEAFRRSVRPSSESIRTNSEAA